MISVTVFSGQTVAVMGLGGSGLATALALREGGARVIAWDDQEKRRHDAEDQGITVKNLKEADWAVFSALILSPGIPLTHPEPHWSVKTAQQMHIPVIGDVELFCLERACIMPDVPLIAITGTNGKSTTTALIAHMLSVAGYHVEMGGNIGTAILSLKPFSPEHVYVVECSSFQIDLAPSLRPSIGILLNLSPDHIDRHGTMEHYCAVKERLIENSSLALIGDDDKWAQKFSERFQGEKRLFSANHLVSNGVFAEGNVVYTINEGKEKEKVAGLENITSLRGMHNAQNACAAIAVAEAFHISRAIIQKGLQTYPGLPHRMEQVGEKDKLLFINDSKATNADSTEKALLSFDNIYWILGGRKKEGGISSLKSLFPKVRQAFLIGEASKEFATDLEGSVPYTFCLTLDIAVRTAYEQALLKGEKAAILLSPACASYDQYKNYEERGDHFRSLVENILK